MLAQALLVAKVLLSSQGKEHGGRALLRHLLPRGRTPLASEGGGIGDVARGTRGAVNVAIDGRLGLEEMMRVLSLGRLLRRVSLLLIRRRVVRAG